MWLCTILSAFESYDSIGLLQSWILRYLMISDLTCFAVDYAYLTLAIFFNFVVYWIIMSTVTSRLSKIRLTLVNLLP